MSLDNLGTYVIVDYSTSGILLIERSPVIANYLVKSGLDLFSEFVFTSFFATQSTHQSYNRYRGPITPLDPALVTPEYLERKRKATLHREYLSRLLVTCEKEISRTVDYSDYSNNAYLISQLDKCNIVVGEFTNVVIEYSSINDIDENTGYQELCLLVESSGMIKLRNYAIFNKYAIQIGSCSSEEELQLVILDAEKTLKIKKDVSQ